MNPARSAGQEGNEDGPDMKAKTADVLCREQAGFIRGVSRGHPERDAGPAVIRRYTGAGSLAGGKLGFTVTVLWLAWKRSRRC